MNETGGVKYNKEDKGQGKSKGPLEETLDSRTTEENGMDSHRNVSGWNESWDRKMRGLEDKLKEKQLTVDGRYV